MINPILKSARLWLAGFGLLPLWVGPACGEAMLQLFNVTGDELVQKIPEIAEAGYTSLWLPLPAKGSSIYSVGYDLFEPFDLGDKNQRGTIRTKYGAKGELPRAVETAHRFGLREGFHIVRARVFLSRTGKSSVFKSFLQTFYYDTQPPGGAIALPPTNGATLTNFNYTVVVRTDSTVTGIEFNVQNSDPNNDDALTGADNDNGPTNGVPKYVSAAPVTPDAALSQQFPNHPLEWRFTYTAVPSSAIIPASGPSAFYYDTSPAAAQKFYRVQVLP